VHIGGRVRRDARKKRRVGIRGIAQNFAQGIEQQRGARSAGSIPHENNSGALMGRGIGFLRKQMVGECLRIGKGLIKRGPQGSQHRGFIRARDP
jgi:hypothetical protein